jgi:hypothetical protein
VNPAPSYNLSVRTAFERRAMFFDMVSLPSLGLGTVYKLHGLQRKRFRCEGLSTGAGHRISQGIIKIAPGSARVSVKIIAEKFRKSIDENVFQDHVIIR